MTTAENFGSRTSAQEITASFPATGKNVVVTGANAGIGFATARALAGGGANVVFACRNTDKGNTALQQTRDKYPDCTASVQSLDLASFDSIRSFAGNLEWSTIDVLIFNAGLVSPKYQETRDGLEMTTGVCHFGHFLLFHTLLDKLQKSTAPRLVVVASDSHKWPPKLNLGNFPPAAKGYSQMKVYGQAKLANVLFANEVQRRFEAQGVTACSLHPGALVTTDIGRGSKLTEFAMKAVSPFTKNIDQGAATSVYCALHPDKAHIGGNYFSHCKRAKPSKETRNQQKARDLWALSEKICGV